MITPLNGLRKTAHSLVLIRARRSGVQVGKDCYLAREGFYSLKASASVVFSASVTFLHQHEIYAEEGAIIHIGDGVHFQRNARIDVGPGARLHIGDRNWFGHDANISALSEIVIGNDGLFAPYAYISDNNHRIAGDMPIKDQGWETVPVTIGDGVWHGVGATVLKGGSVGSGAVLAARAVVTKPVPPYEIWGGIPARKIGCRE